MATLSLSFQTLNLPFLQILPTFSSPGLIPRILRTVYRYFRAYPFFTF